MSNLRSVAIRHDSSVSQEERARRLAAAYRLVLAAGRRAQERQDGSDLIYADSPATAAKGNDERAE